MADLFLQLSETDRKDALEVAASQLGRPAHLLEKDVWVVWALRTLFEAPIGKHLVFKGGTSLSKAFRAIRRFSEDVDVTYDIRAIAPDLAGAALADQGLADDVAIHKSWFFPEKDVDGQTIDYRAAVNGNLCLVPEGEPLEALRIDYQKMVEGGLLFDEPVRFDRLIGLRSKRSPFGVQFSNSHDLYS